MFVFCLWVGSVIPYSGNPAYSVANQQIRQKTVFFQIVEFYVVLSCRCCSVWLQSTVLSAFECCLSNNIFRILVDSGLGLSLSRYDSQLTMRRGVASRHSQHPPPHYKHEKLFATSFLHSVIRWRMDYYLQIRGCGYSIYHTYYGWQSECAGLCMWKNLWPQVVR